VKIYPFGNRYIVTCKNAKARKIKAKKMSQFANLPLFGPTTILPPQKWSILEYLVTWSLAILGSYFDMF
jgi:hypothetical protein